MHRLGLIVLFMLFSHGAWSQERMTEHTFHLPEDAALGRGQLEDVAWLAGSWQGTAFGSRFEEVWNPPSAGSMVGMWKLYDDEKGVNFYELMVLKVEGDGLVLLVKHFSADFVAWEEKAEFEKLRLVKVEDDAVHFSGMSFYRRGEDHIDGYIAMTREDGSKAEAHVAYARVHGDGPGQ